MPKSTLLLADADPRSLRILELALRKAGFDVVTAADGAQALDRILASPPDLVICDLSLPGKDGVALIRALRGEEKLAGLPLLAMSAEKGREPKARAAEAGADDFVVKPILLKDLVQRVDLLLERRRLAEPDAPAALSGKVSELGLLDLFQSLENWKKSAVVRCDSHGQLARVWVREGEVIDADLGPIHGDAAFWRLMTWESGEFRVEFAAVHREVRVEGGTQGALMEAMRRVDELAQIAEQLPMSTELTLDFGALAARLGDLPDEVNGVVRCFDGKRTLREALDLSPMDDLSTLAVVQRLMGDGILRASAPRPVVRKPSLEKWLSDPPRVPAGLAPPEAERMQETVAQPEKAAGPEDPAQAPAPARPAAAAKPLDVVHFPALRGVRRERLRREADEARTRVAAGQAVRLTHVVELPAFQPDKTDAIDGARSMSPAVGEAARKYAPDIPVSRVLTGAAWDKATDPSYRLPQAPITEPPTPPAPIVLEKSDPGAAPAPVAPVVITTPPPQVQAALGLGRRPLLKRWQVMALAAVAAAVAGLVFRPQPPTDKKDAPWLKEERPAPVASKKVPDALPGQPPLAPAPASPAATPPAPAPAVTTASVVVTPDATAYGKALEQGESLLSRGKYRAAVGELKRAAKLRPESVPALLALGDAYLEANLPKSALGPLEGAARIDAKSSRAQLLLGTAYQSLGRNGDAVKAYGRYLELEPEGKFARDVNVILANLKR